MNKPRIIVAALTLSAAGLVGIATHEGYRSDAYTPVKGDVATIGFGDTHGVKLGDRTDPVRALIRLGDHVEAFQVQLRKCIEVPLFQYEWDAWVSFAYNTGVTATCNSTAIKKLNAGDYEGACNEMSRWVYVGGKRIPGLVARREKEKVACLGN